MTTVLYFQGQRMKVQRELMELEQSELAERTGISRSQVAMLETGRSEPSISTLVGLSWALNCTTDWLLGIDDRDEIEASE